jgi:hypothetical protein
MPHEDASPAAPMDGAPILLRLRSGKTAALVIAGGFGGGTLVLGTASTAASAARGTAIVSALLGYGIAILPLLVLAAIIAVCRSELWLVPESRTLRMLTYRPWRRLPRVEEAPLSEYAGVRTSRMTDDYGNATLVSLVTTGGEDVPLRQFSDEVEAHAYAEKLGSAAGFWVRAADETKPATA